MFRRYNAFMKTGKENTVNYMKERNIGGAIHDLYSTAALVRAGE